MKLLMILVKETRIWFETFIGYLPGKIGTFSRMIWYRYRWRYKKYINWYSLRNCLVKRYYI